jgi:hypothetical protein
MVTTSAALAADWWLIDTFSEAEFLSWATARGIAFHPAYPKVAILNFADTQSASRFWEVPPEPERRPFFLSALLDGMGEWSTCFVWRHSGSWPSSGDDEPRSINNALSFRYSAFSVYRWGQHE